MLRAPIPSMESVSALNEHLAIATAVGAAPVSRASPRRRWPSCLRPRRQSGSARTRSRRSEATATCRNMASSFPAYRLCTTTSRPILPCHAQKQRPHARRAASPGERRHHRPLSFTRSNRFLGRGLSFCMDRPFRRLAELPNIKVRQSHFRKERHDLNQAIAE